MYVCLYACMYLLSTACCDVVTLSSLGSTRFLKVASATHTDGTEVVVKVFAKHDPLLQLEPYRNKLLNILRKLQGVANALPFQHFWVSHSLDYLGGGGGGWKGVTNQLP